MVEITASICDEESARDFWIDGKFAEVRLVRAN
jgi:hypothetical protein